VATAIAQFYGWKRYLSDRISFSFLFLERQAASYLLRSGGVLAVWTFSGLFVSGLDTVLVGRFDFQNTGFYAIAVTATNLLIYVVGSVLVPLVPAVSALQTTGTPAQIGDITIRVSRYCALILCALGLPLIVAAFPLLSLWVGHDYALKSVIFLQVLVFANFVRQLGYPYSLIVIATGKQHLATIAGVSEAVINLVVSIWLANKIGALGVALGTVIGAFVSVVLHLTVSMNLTRSAISLSAADFLRQGLLRPLTCVLPFLLLLPLWRRNSMLPAPVFALVAWLAATLLIGYFFGLTRDDRLTAQRWFARPRPASDNAGGHTLG
jgi:O-antigen/teichoic acid export membrane protein